jgi:hypothetical protein
VKILGTTPSKANAHAVARTNPPPQIYKANTTIPEGAIHFAQISFLTHTHAQEDFRAVFGSVPLHSALDRDQSFGRLAASL